MNESIDSYFLISYVRLSDYKTKHQIFDNKWIHKLKNICYKPLTESVLSHFQVRHTPHTRVIREYCIASFGLSLSLS